MPEPRQLHLNAFLMSVGHHEAAWRLPESDPFANTEVSHYQELARVAERGLLDSVFFADSPSLMSNPARRPAEAVDPVILLAAMSAVTERIGLIATASTTYDEPYNVARRFASLDTISHGRAGWNVVTSAAEDAGANFGYDTIPGHATRYARAQEFLEVVTGLWAGWEPGAVVADKAAGVYADPSKVHTLDHRGEHFAVRGPLNVGRSPQGSPVLVQAGSSPAGIALAARFAEAVFTAQRSLEDGQAFYRELKSATARVGRNPEHLKVLPGIVPILGGVCVGLAGAVQFTRWKGHQLECCGELSAPGRNTIAAGDGAGAAWRHGLSLGVRCARCCGNLMAILLVVGVMDLAAMAVVTIGITAERFAPGDRRLVRRIGAVAVGAGVVMLVRAVVQRFS